MITVYQLHCKADVAGTTVASNIENRTDDQANGNLTTKANSQRFPYGPMKCAGITSKACEDYSKTPTSVWKVLCFMVLGRTRSCFSECHSSIISKQLRCQDFCQGTQTI